jgi:hypothetical protein
VVLKLLSLALRATPMDIASTIGPRKIVINVMTLYFPEESCFSFEAGLRK